VSRLLRVLATGLCVGACRAPETGVREAHLGELRIHYEDAGGDAPEAIVLIHGWASSTAAWRHQFPALSDRARVLAVDLVGHGESDAPDHELSMAVLADSVIAAMNTAGVERAVLVGHSNGVPVAANVYRRYPERTLAIVGIDGTLKPLFGREDFDRFFAPFLGEGWRDAMRAMIDGMPGPGLSDEDRAAIAEMALATPHASVVGAARAQLDPAAWGDGPIDVPLLLILARQPTWNEAYADWVRERAPGVDYRVWDDVGHYVQMERPQELRAALLEFLARNRLLE